MDERFGFIRDKLDIKILILFILRRLPAAVTPDTLAELAICEDSISYFDYSECIAELIDSGHMLTTEDGYVITEKGRKNGEITESSLPYTIRMRAEKAVQKIADTQRRDALITMKHTPRGRGFIVTLALEDEVGPIVSMQVYAANEAQAEMMERGFHSRAEEIVTRLLDDLVPPTSTKDNQK
jgi:hypothetical protein